MVTKNLKWSTPGSKPPSKHRLGSLHVGRDKRIYRVSWANAAKKTNVWRIYRKPLKPARRQVGKSKLRGGTVRPKIPIRAQVHWCMLYKYYTFPTEVTDYFVIMQNFCGTYCTTNCILIQFLGVEHAFLPGDVIDHFDKRVHIVVQDLVCWQASCSCTKRLPR